MDFKLRHIEHFVILMQENRSFDHYFGTLPSVRGFADLSAITLPTGKSVFYQPDPSHADGYLTPFHFDTAKTRAQATPALDHSWGTQHSAWNHGAMDKWVAAKGPFTMGYFTRDDIPFHFALAEAFTVCDHYYCSVLGPTHPNRLHMWSGTIDPTGAAGGPVIDNSPTASNPVCRWTTYPERLQAAGVSWRVYQEEDNYDNNALAWFEQYANAPSSSPLYKNAMIKRSAGWFEHDAKRDKLPQVSWIVAPTRQSEHPAWMPAAGAEFIASKIDAVASNPEVWGKTVFILTYDENDGYFDHVPPPVPAPNTADEFIGGDPIGLGFRVPTIVVSPWTAGGSTYSGTLDHTSLLRLLERRFGVLEPNISAWRRRTMGDFTNIFDFSHRRPFPSSGGNLELAAVKDEFAAAQREVRDNPRPIVPAISPPLPIR